MRMSDSAIFFSITLSNLLEAKNVVLRDGWRYLFLSSFVLLGLSYQFDRAASFLGLFLNSMISIDCKSRYDESKERISRAARLIVQIVDAR